MIVLAFAVGFVAGLRVFTPPAVLYLMLRGGWIGIALGVCAIGEYVVDALPQIPPRTSLPSPILRIASGAFCGWTIALALNASAVAGAVLGIAGAIAGTWGGLTFRRWLIASAGAIPAAILEDAGAIALAVLLVLPAQARTQAARASNAGPVVGAAAPAFTLTTLDGNTVTLGQYRGKTLVLNVWGSWCPPCRLEAEDLTAESNAVATENVAFLGVDTTESASVAKAFIVAKNVTYPQAVATSSSAFARDYNIDDFPTTFVIDPGGVIRAIHMDNVLVRRQLHAYIEAARIGRTARLVTPEQARLDAMLAPSRYPFAAAASVRHNVLAASAAIDKADSELDASMTDAARDHDYAKTKSEEQALRLRAIAALRAVARTTADRELIARLEGDAAVQRNDWNAADSAYGRALTLMPRDTAALSGRAYVAFQKGDRSRQIRYDRQIANIQPAYSAYVSLALDEASAGEAKAANGDFLHAVALAKNVKGVAGVRDLAWTYLYFGRGEAKLGDKASAREAFANALSTAKRLPANNQYHDMYLEEAQEGGIALDVGSARAALSIAPWSGADLPGSVQSTSKFRLVVAGSAGSTLDLRASQLPPGWIGSFCSDRVCSPFHSKVTLPSAGVKVVEFQIVPGDTKARRVRARIDARSQGRTMASVTASVD